MKQGTNRIVFPVDRVEANAQVFKSGEKVYYGLSRAVPSENRSAINHAGVFRNGWVSNHITEVKL